MSDKNAVVIFCQFKGNILEVIDEKKFDSVENTINYKHNKKEMEFVIHTESVSWRKDNVDYYIVDINSQQLFF